VGILLISLIQLLFFASLVFLWMKMKRSMDDDSRWSRGLQFLQSKIAVFEDLSDRTEHQVAQLTVMMEQKICELQRKIDEADQVLNKISQSMKKSIEVAQIFQDKIPHEEIIERQNTVRFVKAALMANEGKSVEEIAEVIELPRAQIEFIVKVNAERLSFDTGQIPDWLKAELNKDPMTKSNLFEKKSLETLATPSGARTVLRPLQQVLKDRNLDFEEKELEPVQVQLQRQEEATSIGNTMTTPKPIAEPSLAPFGRVVTSDSVVGTAKTTSSYPLSGGASEANTQATNLAQGVLGKKAKDMGIRPVVFPRIDMPR
jgi:hypothetical protein